MDIPFIALGVLTLVSLGGLVLYFWKEIPRTPLMFLVALGAGSMLSVSLAHILPEALEGGGEYAIYAFLAGFVFLYILEEILTPHHHDTPHGDHTHEDPHEHSNHVTLVAWSGIFLHTLLDGLSIAVGFTMSKEIGYAVIFGIILHQLPVSLGLAGILRQSNISIKYQYILMILFGFAGFIGYIISLGFLAHMNEGALLLAGAFAGGSLLYIATTDLIPMIHGATKKKYSTLCFFLSGVLLMLGAHEIGHEHHEHEDITITEIH